MFNAGLNKRFAFVKKSELLFNEGGNPESNPYGAVGFCPRVPYSNKSILLYKLKLHYCRLKKRSQNYSQLFILYQKPLSNRFFQKLLLCYTTPFGETVAVWVATKGVYPFRLSSKSVSSAAALASEN